MGEHLIARHLGKSASGKTDIYRIQNRFNGIEIGQVSWLGRARGYVFDTRDGVSLTTRCMDDISEFCRSVRRSWLSEKKKGIISLSPLEGARE